MQVFFVQFIIILDLALIFPICKYSILFCPANIFHLRSNKISSILQVLSLHDFFIKFYKHINCRRPPFIFVEQQLCPYSYRAAGNIQSFNLSVFHIFLRNEIRKKGKQAAVFYLVHISEADFRISRTGRISSDWDARVSFSIFSVAHGLFC